MVMGEKRRATAGIRPGGSFLRGTRGLTYLEALISIAIIALAVPLVAAGIRLTAAGNYNARAEVIAANIAQERMEWLRAHCTQHLDVLLGYEVGNPGECDHDWVGEELDVPGHTGFRYRTDVEEVAFNLVSVTVTVWWERPGGTTAVRTFSTLIEGSQEGYWE